MEETNLEEFTKAVPWNLFMQIKDQLDIAQEVLDILMPFLSEIELERTFLRENITLPSGKKIGSGNAVIIISPDELFSIQRSIISIFNKSKKD